MQGLTWVGALIGVREGAVGKSEGRIVGGLGEMRNPVSEGSAAGFPC